MFAAMPPSFTQRYVAMRKLRDAFQEEMALALAPALNTWAKHSPMGSNPQRVALTAEVGHFMHILGLAMKGPRTGEPADLTVEFDPESPNQLAGFLFRERTGRKHASLKATLELPPLVPMNDPPQLQSLDRWTNLAKRSDIQR